jgi:hypothetical protein
MPAKDLFHHLVRTALQQEGWKITHDPYTIQLEFTSLCIDLGAERIIAAMKDEVKIAVEIKSFTAPSTISEFHTAIGQFINYRIALEDEDPDRQLYLGVPTTIYEKFFHYRFVQKVITKNHVPLLVYQTDFPKISWVI